MNNELLPQNRQTALASLLAKEPEILTHALREVRNFCQLYSRQSLRHYQCEVAQAIVRSVLAQKGLSIVVIFPRQSGKNFVQSQIEVYLLALFASRGAEMLKFSPTLHPQSLNAMRRLESALEGNFLTRGAWRKQAGNHYSLGLAHLSFLSAAPESNVVSATASTLLQLDEAQDISIDKYDKEIAPMAASTHATRVFWGTAWTAHTLLARELRLAQKAQDADGQKRVFVLNAEQVAAELPAYGLFVAEQIQRLRRNHPMVASQFFSEELDGVGSLFTANRLNLMQGTHAPQSSPLPGSIYAFLLDLAGEDESAYSLEAGEGELQNRGRDSSALTIVEVLCKTAEGDELNQPHYHIVQRLLWTGEKQPELCRQLARLIELWGAQKVVVDASGVGAGIASFLREQFRERIIPLVFSQQLKSKLAWGFLAVIDSGRFRDYLPADKSKQIIHAPARQTSDQAFLQALFFRQLKAVSYEVSNGPEHLMRWSVPEGARDSDGNPLHDDLALSASMVAILDQQTWGEGREALLIEAPDPLHEIDGGF